MQVTASVFINAMGTYRRKKSINCRAFDFFFCKIIAISKDVPLSFANEQKRGAQKRNGKSKML